MEGTSKRAAIAVLELRTKVNPTLEIQRRERMSLLEREQEPSKEQFRRSSAEGSGQGGQRARRPQWAGGGRGQKRSLNSTKPIYPQVPESAFH